MVEMKGSGNCYGSFGELLQGVLPGEKKFLVNLRISNASRTRIHLMPSIYSNEKERLFADSYRSFSKSYKVVRNILVDIGRHDDCFLEIDSDIPVGKGCSSSTSDMVASIQALASALSLALKPEYVSKMLTEIEPNDGLHYSGTSIYHHTTGKLIFHYDYTPPLRILGIDFGGTIDSVEFNQKTFSWSDTVMEKYAALLETTKKALADEDVEILGNIATESTLMWQEINPKPHLDRILRFAQDNKALGVVNTHSGTYLGILFPEGRKDPQEIQLCANSTFPDCVIRWFETAACVSESRRDHL